MPKISAIMLAMRNEQSKEEKKKKGDKDHGKDAKVS